MRKLSSGNDSSSAGSWRSQGSSSCKSKEFSRPPVYNPEDYAVSLKKWIGKLSHKNADHQDIVPQPFSNEGEMSLRQFLNVSDLLNKLKTDLRLAFLSFVQEFVSDPVDGTVLLLELLRSIQLNDTQHQGKVTPSTHRRALLDENSCLQCLQYCLRCEETTRRLSMSSIGLFTLAVCIMSSVSKSRIISLELLSEICRYSSVSGHNAVSEAMSTMRLRFGEPVRFRFLVSMLNGASSDLLIAGLQFINTFLETSPNKQIQLYIQAELEQAGLNSETFKKLLSLKDHQNDLIIEEFNRWSKLHIDVDVLKRNYENKCGEISALKEKISQLEAQIRILQNEKETLSARENSYKERFSDLEYHMSVSRSNSINKSYSISHRSNMMKRECGGNSTPAEDEGISSSDQDDIEEIMHSHSKYKPYEIYCESKPCLENVAFKKEKIVEPTIDEVMEDFQNIINDVQNENYRNEQRIENLRKDHYSNSDGRSSNESLSEALILDKESDIVPTKILPEPPKKSRSLHMLNKNTEMNPFFEDESVDNSNHSCTSRCSYQKPLEKTSRFGHLYENGMEDARSQAMARNRNQKPSLRRSETFHHLQIDTSHMNHEILRSKYIENTLQNQNIRTENVRNKNYIVQNYENTEKEYNNKNKDVSPGKLLRSISTKPVGNVKASKNSAFLKINPVTYFSKTNHFPVNSQQFTLKRHNNAGLYSDKNHIQINNNNLHQVITITSEYPKRSLNGLKQINLNICDGKIMDLPSGLY